MTFQVFNNHMNTVVVYKITNQLGCNLFMEPEYYVEQKHCSFIFWLLDSPVLTSILWPKSSEDISYLMYTTFPYLLKISFSQSWSA